MKKVLAMMLALVMVLAVTAQAASFPDMEESRWDWARETVEGLAELGIVKGYNDGTYKPENSVTNQEAFTLFARVIGVNDEKYAQAVADAQVLYQNVAEMYETYAVKELCFLLYRGILTTEDLDEYLSEETKNVPMQRHEAAKLITKILNGVEEVNNAGMFVFDYTDADTFPVLSKGYIYYVTDKNIMSGMGDGTFSPETGVTRAQIAIMLKRTMDKLALNSVSGTVTAAEKDALTVNGQTYEVSANVFVHRNGAAATMEDIEAGDYVTVTTTYQGVLAVDAVETEESASNTKVIEGIYRGSLTDTRGTFVKIYDKAGGVNTTESYILSNGAVTYTVNGEKRASLTAITETDYVYATMVAGKIVHIDAKSKIEEVENATLTALVHEEDTNLLKIAHKDAKYDATAWKLASSVKVKRNGKDAGLTDLLVGDSIKFTVTYGEVTAITATSKTSTVKGTITAIHIEREMPYITVKISDTKSQTIYLTMDTKINIDDGLGDIYDLLLGYNVTISTESDTASKITVTSVATTNTLTGTVTLVNEALGFINISAVNVTTGEITQQQIFINDKTSIRAGSNSAVVKASAIAVGDSLFATGLEKVGAFEATTIIVINK